MTVAGGAIIGNALAAVIGRRPVYLVSSLLLVVTSFWAGGSKDLGTLTAARAIAGLALGPFECLMPATISDVFFLEERGFQLALFSMAWTGGINLVAPISGALQQAAGIANAFYGMGGAFTVMLILQFFFWSGIHPKINLLSVLTKVV